MPDFLTQTIDRMGRALDEARCKGDEQNARIDELTYKVQRNEQQNDETKRDALQALAMANDAIERVKSMETKEPEAPEPFGNPYDMPKRILRTVPKQKASRPFPRRQTVCIWDDGTVTHAGPSRNTPYDPYTGLAICLVKRLAELDESARHFGWSLLVFGYMDANRQSGASYGMDYDAAYKLAVMGAGTMLYAGLLDPRQHGRNVPQTFGEYVRAVLDDEAKKIAAPKARDFFKRLERMRTDAAIHDWKERHERQLQERRDILRKEAEANGASMFEAWQYALNAAPDERRPDIHKHVDHKERERIANQALREAQQYIQGLREVVTFDTVPF